ncbi:unnamed protein product [Gordionus sp. m RMFG-2023]
MNSVSVAPVNQCESDKGLDSWKVDDDLRTAYENLSSELYTRAISIMDQNMVMKPDPTAMDCIAGVLSNSQIVALNIMGSEIRPNTFEGSRPDYEIRNARRDEIPQISEWRYKEFGYRAHIDYLLNVYDSDPEGWFVAVLSSGEVIGNVVGMILNDQVAFGGLYCVKKEYRCHGIGSELWKARMKHVQPRNLGLNSVDTRIQSNLKLGMKASFNIATYVGTVTPQKIENIKRIYSNDSSLDQSKETNRFSILKLNSLTVKDYMDTLISYDTKIHSIERTQFLKAMTIGSKDTTVALALSKETPESELTIVGYGLLKPRHVGSNIGPLYADNSAVGQALLGTLIGELNPTSHSLLDISVVEDATPSPRQSIVKTFILSLELVRECLITRMYSQMSVALPLPKVYSIFSTEAFLV